MEQFFYLSPNLLKELMTATDFQDTGHSNDVFSSDNLRVISFVQAQVQLSISPDAYQPSISVDQETITVITPRSGLYVIYQGAYQYYTVATVSSVVSSSGYEGVIDLVPLRQKNLIRFSSYNQEGSASYYIAVFRLKSNARVWWGCDYSSIERETGGTLTDVLILDTDDPRVLARGIEDHVVATNVGIEVANGDMGDYDDTTLVLTPVTQEQFTKDQLEFIELVQLPKVPDPSAEYYVKSPHDAGYGKGLYSDLLTPIDSSNGGGKFIMEDGNSFPETIRNLIIYDCLGEERLSYYGEVSPIDPNDEISGTCSVILVPLKLHYQDKPRNFKI